MSHARPPTLQDIAQKARVSGATVSLALRGHPSIPEATRRRIQDVARQLGYFPNPLVTALMAHVRRSRKTCSTLTIAYITSWNDQRAWRERPVYEFFVGASERAGQLGYNLEAFSSREREMTGARLSKVLLTRNIHGLILEPIPYFRTKGHLSMHWSQFACVVIGFTLPKPDLHRVGPNDYANTRLALRSLYRLGYQRVGLAMRLQDDSRVDRRCTSAYLGYQQDLPPTKQLPPLIPNRLTERNVMAWFRKYRPDAVLTNEQLIPGWLGHAGLRVPRDVGVAHPNLPRESQTLAGINSRARSVGAVAMDLVEAQLHRNERGIPAEPRLVLVEGTWCNGTSIRSKSS